MTEQELRRTAVIIPPTGRAVLCVWAAVPGLFAAPFVFWQSIVAGAGFCLLWGFLVYCLWARACSFAAVLGERTVTVYSGVALPVRQVLPRRAVTSVRLLRTPLLRLGGVSLLIVAAPGAKLFLPAIPAQQAGLNALLTALRQDAALLLFLCGASSILLEASSWALDEAGVLRLRWAFLSKQERIIRGETLAALTIERPLFFRLLGASRVVLYPVGQPAKRAVTLYLHKEDAQELADRLMPVRDPVCHRAAGGERAALVVLGANGLSTLALTYLAIRQSRPFPLTAEAVALSRLNVLVRFAAHWLPAGAAWMLVLTGSLFGISLARSFVQTVHYTVWHTADQLGSRGGWLSRFEFRVRSSEISYADVRVSPIARLMKRWPVFVVAGSCRPELPLFVYRSGQEELFRELLPEFRMPPDTRHDLTHRSAVFFAPAGIPFGLCLLLVLASRSVLPALTGTLLIPTAVFAVFLAGGLMGWLKEGIWLREGRFTLRRQKGVYLHCICVFHPDVCLRTFQSPWAARYQRMTLTLALPGQVRLKVRSIPVRDAAPCLNALEQKT